MPPSRSGRPTAAPPATLHRRRVGARRPYRWPAIGSLRQCVPRAGRRDVLPLDSLPPSARPLVALPMSRVSTPVDPARAVGGRGGLPSRGLPVGSVPGVAGGARTRTGLVAGRRLRGDLRQVVAVGLPGDEGRVVAGWLRSRWCSSTSGSAACSMSICWKPACTRLIGSGEYPIGPISPGPGTSSSRGSRRGSGAWRSSSCSSLPPPVGMIMYEYEDSG